MDYLLIGIFLIILGYLAVDFFHVKTSSLAERIEKLEADFEILSSHWPKNL